MSVRIGLAANPVFNYRLRVILGQRYQAMHSLCASMLPNWVVAAAVTTLAGVVGLAVYRLYFHPLAKFPGRRLAAMTMWYEFYYDVIKRGQYVFEIQKMHEEYGILPL